MPKLKLMKRILLYSMLLSTFFFNAALGAQIEVFSDGFTNPTGLIVNTVSKKLYVNCGTNGNIWSVSIGDEGMSGGVELVSAGFTPKLDLAMDASMNIYGVVHGNRTMYRLSPTGEVTVSNVSSTSGTGIVIESPGLFSNKIYYATGNSLEFIYISSYAPGRNSSRDGHFSCCGKIRFMQWRKGLNEIIGTHGNEVVAINPNNGSCNAIATGMLAPYGITQDKSGNIYVADTMAGTISQITSLGDIKVVVEGLNSPTGLAYDDETNLMFVSESGTGKIYSIDMSIGDICPEVVTFGENPVTGKVTVFPTPCDVPLGWNRTDEKPNWFENSSTEDLDLKYQEGYEAGVIKGLSECDVVPIEDNKCASFDLPSKILHVPCLDIGTKYSLDLELQGDHLIIKNVTKN